VGDDNSWSDFEIRVRVGVEVLVVKVRCRERRVNTYLGRSILEPTTEDRLSPMLDFVGVGLLTNEVPAPDCRAGVAERLEVLWWL
jgi:hypothetical protein